MKVGIILHFSKGVIVSSVLIISAQRRVQKYLISLTGFRNRVVSDRGAGECTYFFFLFTRNATK